MVINNFVVHFQIPTIRKTPRNTKSKNTSMGLAMGFMRVLDDDRGSTFSSEMVSE